MLTGEYVIVSNYPGTTVEVKSGKAARLDYYVVDTPGITSVVPRSEEERVTLKTLVTENFSAVLQVGDFEPHRHEGEQGDEQHRPGKGARELHGARVVSLQRGVKDSRASAAWPAFLASLFPFV